MQLTIEEIERASFLQKELNKLREIEDRIVKELRALIYKIERN